MNKTKAAVSIIVRANPKGLKQQISDHRLEMFGIINKTPRSGFSITNWASSTVYRYYSTEVQSSVFQQEQVNKQTLPSMRFR